MKNVLKNYKSTLVLLGSIIIGGIVGIIFKEKALFLKPFGDVFINLLFIVIVPLIFLTITSGIIKMANPKRLGKIMSRIVIIFAVLSIISVLIGIVGAYSTKLVNKGDSVAVKELFDQEVVMEEELSILERTASLITVSDFPLLLSKNNIIALLIFSIIFGFAIRMSNEKGKVIKEAIISLNDIVLNIIKIIMYYAPIGLGCYFAALIGTYGDSIVTGFLKTFVIYTITCGIVFTVVYSIYALIAGGKEGLKVYWKHVITPSVTSIATCSSAACIPVNLTAIKNMGVSDDIAETTVPMGTSFHKQGSAIGSVFKIMFLAYLFEITPSLWTVIIVSLVATLLVSAVPIGGGTISEMLILSMMSFPVAALPILTIIATIIDAPATLLNVTGDTSASMLIARSVDGKDWMKKKKPKKTKKEAK
ncbi:MAG: dicarboxylate/amino acid:cation symporter [Bacilli bacterium]|nr:dicarboxylate/amino acid:cation symporter [Bacilli bacterium]